MRLEIAARGQELVNRDLLRFSDNLEVPIAALEEVAAHLRLVALRQFDTQGGYASGGWQRLAASTLRQKMRKGQDPRILRATERLRGSLIDKFDADHFEEPLSPNTLRFGTTVPYAIFHQTGTGRMPARRPIELTAADRVSIVKEVQRSLIAGMRGRATL